MTFPIYGTKNVPNHQPDIHLSLELHLQVGMCGVGKHGELAATQSHTPWVSQQEYGFKSKNVALGLPKEAWELNQEISVRATKIIVAKKEVNTLVQR